MTPKQAKDEIRRMRAEIIDHKKMNRILKEQIRQLKRRPIGQRDPLQVLNIQTIINERQLLVIRNNRRIEELKLYL